MHDKFLQEGVISIAVWRESALALLATLLSTSQAGFVFDLSKIDASEDQTHVELAAVSTGDDLVFVKALFVEYAEAFSHLHCFGGFDQELEAMPEPYTKPDGALFLAQVNGRPAGCIAVKRVGKKDAEIKRLYVRPDLRGHSLGRLMTEAAVQAARDMGYKTLRLETLPGAMAVAISVYRALGFKPCKPYGKNPVDIADHYALKL